MIATLQTIEALITLLDDSDELVLACVSEKLISLGYSVIEPLEEASLKADSEILVCRIEDIIAKIKANSLIDKFEIWVKSEERSVLEGWILISAIHHPAISTEKTSSLLKKLSKDIWLELSESMTTLEKISVINYTIFKQNDFEIASGDSVSLDNIILDNFLFTKTGSTIALTLLYMILAKEVNVSLSPITISNKLFLGYQDQFASSVAYGDSSNKFLFYLNVGHKGSLISPNEIQFLIDRSKKYGKYETKVESEISLIRKLLKFMRIQYDTNGEKEKLRVAEMAIKIIESC